MKMYYDLFVELSLQQCTALDYTDKAKVKAHNTASKKLQQLEAKMRNTDCRRLLKQLLSHEDIRVRLNASSVCLKMGLLVDDAIGTLQKIVDSSSDPTLSFSAKMLLLSFLQN